MLEGTPEGMIGQNSVVLILQVFLWKELFLREESRKRYHERICYTFPDTVAVGVSFQRLLGGDMLNIPISTEMQRNARNIHQ